MRVFARILCASFAGSFAIVAGSDISHIHVQLHGLKWVGPNKLQLQVGNILSGVLVA